MKKCIVLIFILFCGLLFSQDFRNVKWGMTRAQVIKAEKLKVDIDDKDFLQYKTTFLNEDANIYYYFYKDLLYKSVIIKYQKNVINPDSFFDVYDKFKKAVISKYGEPIKEINKIPDPFDSTPNLMGLGLSLGKISYTSYWDIDKSIIINMLYGEDNTISCLICYYSKEYKYLEDESRQAEIDENL